MMDQQHAPAVATSLFCTCGRRFFPMGVEPGNLAKCPGCGAWIRVPIVEEDSALAPPRRRVWRPEPTAAECLLYPLRDGPGIALLVVMPPFVWLLSVPVFDLIRFTWSGPRGTFNPFALIVWPLAMPLMLCFFLVSGYILIFFGAVLVSSALGRYEHPRWPPWDRWLILEGVGRWMWATLVGVAVAFFPISFYASHCGPIDPIDLVVLTALATLGIAYGQMALTASLLHDNLVAANPVTVVLAIYRVGWPYLGLCLTTIASLATLGVLGFFVLFRSPSLVFEAVGLWGFWVLYLYLGMVILRMLGLFYYQNAARLAWFERQPHWQAAGREGTIYVNS